MQSSKRIIAAVLFSLMLCLCLATHAEELTLSLDVTDTTIAAGTTIKVVPSLSDETITKVKYKWETSDKKVATVSNGSVRAVGEGSATITCSAAVGGKTVQASLNVNVYVAVKSVTVKKKSITLEVGKTEKVEATINPKNATNQELTWMSSNPSVATVDENGRIKAVYGGECTITATTKDSSEKSASVSVFVPSMSCSTKEVYLTLGRTSQFSVNLYTKNKSAIKYGDNNASNNWHGAKVNDDKLDFKIIPWLAGQSTLTITDSNSPKSTIKIKLITTSENGIRNGYRWIKSDNDYRSWLRGSNYGEYVRVSGYVRQIEYSNKRVWLFVATKQKYDNYVYSEFEIPSVTNMPRIVVGDSVILVGKNIGTYKYTTTLGSSNTVPRIETMLVCNSSGDDLIYYISDYYTDMMKWK